MFTFESSPAIALMLGMMVAGYHEELGEPVAIQSERVEVSDLTFVGVDAFDPSRIRSLLKTQESDWLPWGETRHFDREAFEDDLERIEAFYHDQGFPAAEVTSFDIDVENGGRSVAVTVTVTEGEPDRFAGIALEGFEVLSQEVREELPAAVGLVEGEPLGTPDALGALEIATNALKDHGYPYAEVVATRHERGPGWIELRLSADPGNKAYFGPIEIAGNIRVDDEIIRRQLLYRPGEPYSRAIVLSSQRRLTSLQLFEFVNVETIDGDARPAEVRTRVTVTETDPRRLSFAVGYGTEEKLTGEAGWEHVNFLGGARTFGVHGKWSWLDRGVEGRLVQPYFLRPDLALSLHARGWYVDEPGFRAKSEGAQATITRARGGPFSSSASFIHEFESSRIANEALLDLSLRDELIALGLNPTTGVQDGILSAVVFEAQHVTVENPLDARSGHLLSAHIEQAGGWLPGTFNYYNLIGEARFYGTRRGKVTIAQRLRYGSIDAMGPDSDVPFFKRYFLGGSTSLRGWGRYEVSPLSGSGLPIGGHTLFESSSEVRFPLFGKLSGVLFLDAGNVWRDSWDFRAGDLLYDAGPGLRYQTPIGPVRLDVAYQLNRLEGLLIDGEPQQRRWRIHFSIGQAF
jgi:outer membrane protein insertion porin family/translocation and assembly module TamA